MRRWGLSIVFVLVLVACRTHPLEKAREQVQMGMSRNEAVEILSKEAWYYQACREGDGFVTDLFFFGDHRYDKADIVIVESKQQEGIYYVTDIGSFESYAWQTAYGDCIQRDRFDD